MQSDLIIHDSHSCKYRSPFGAVSCGVSVKITIAVLQSLKPDKVVLRLWGNKSHEERIVLKADKETEGDYHIYRGTIKAPNRPGWLWYSFVLEKGASVLYYGNPDKLGGKGMHASSSMPAWQITVHEAAMTTPAWFKDAVMYQIFVDRFYNGNPDGKINNPPKGSVLHSHWDNEPVYIRDVKNNHVLSYDFGGNLAGVIAKLPYLKEMGISVIYFNPIFSAASNHKYDTGDYKTIDPIFGDNELFNSLCLQAKSMGIEIILDGVFSHTGSDSIYFNKEGKYPDEGAYQSQDSTYYDWYRFDEWPDKYESWWGITSMPNVEEKNPAYQKYIIDGKDSVVKQWASLGAKGWRLDVADELPDEFIQKMRKTLKKLDPDSILLGEVWEDASNKESYGILRPYLQGKELDSVMNYPFRNVVLEFMLGRMDSTAATRKLMAIKENYPAEHFYTCMNLLGSHDVPRIITMMGDENQDEELTTGELMKKRLNAKQYERAVYRVKSAVLWQMTFPGVPSIYYGDEAGLEGYKDPLNRRTYPWGKENRELLDWHKKLTTLRNKYAVLRTGDWQPLQVDSDIIVYTRSIEDGKDVFGQTRDNNFALIAINRSEQSKKISIVIGERDGRTMMYDLLDDEKEVPTGNGVVTLKIPPYGARLLMERLIPATHGSCGILLHPTSLPSSYGIGDLGAEAYKFVDFLVSSKQSMWQILPLNPPGIAESPYMALSAFAGNSLLISPEILLADGLLAQKDIDTAINKTGTENNFADRVDFEQAKLLKEKLLRSAFENFKQVVPSESYEAFIKENKEWLPDYALFMALNNEFAGKQWNEWDNGLVIRDATAMNAWRIKLTDEIAYQEFLQYLFSKQWLALKKYANKKGIKIIGDLPIFVAHHSADVWANQELFDLTSEGTPTEVAGVPPDYFSEDGQRWGNPLYKWELMKKDNYGWWKKRFETLLKQVDVIRVDHFRGFESYWSIPADEPTAVNGKWKKGPGVEFFQQLEEKFGKLPIIAEDLGIITDEVVQLKNAMGFPGMKVLHFCFGDTDDGISPALGITDDSVVYTGTHDNNTTVGWYKEDLPSVSLKKCIDSYIGINKKSKLSDVAWGMIELAYQSRAQSVIIPLQDILALPETARMNLPGTVTGNWSWRCPADYGLTKRISRLKKLVKKYGR